MWWKYIYTPTDGSSEKQDPEDRRNLFAGQHNCSEFPCLPASLQLSGLLRFKQRVSDDFLKMKPKSAPGAPIDQKSENPDS